LLFIDGRNDAQCGWALRQCQAHPRAKVILVAGDPFALMDTWHRPVYFDQGGQLTGKLGIRHVPARVTQGEMVLAIEEVLDNEGL
jgi:conjugal transfer pilus assembly protein TraW